MQIDRKEFDPERHDIFSALTVKQPYADLMTRAVYRDEYGAYHALKTIEVRTRSTKFRGDLLICSSMRPEVPGRLSGVTCGFVELYDVKPLEEFTPEDWDQTCIPPEERAQFRKGYGWMMRNPRRVVEMPCKGQLGIHRFVTPKGDIMEYPREMAMGADGWKIVQKKIK